MKNKQEITQSDCTFTLYCEPEDMPLKGNVMVSGDEAIDRSAERDVQAQIDSGNEWAWCVVFVRCEIEIGWETFEGLASLGGCSYNSKEEFIADDYYEELCDQAYDDMIIVPKEQNKRCGAAAIAVADAFSSWLFERNREDGTSAATKQEWTSAAWRKLLSAQQAYDLLRRPWFTS